MSKHIFYLGNGDYSVYGLKIKTKIEQLFPDCVVTVTNSAISITNWGTIDRNISFSALSTSLAGNDQYLYVDTENNILVLIGGSPTSTNGPSTVIGNLANQGSFPMILYEALCLNKSSAQTGVNGFCNALSNGDLLRLGWPDTPMSESQGRPVYCPDVIDNGTQTSWDVVRNATYIQIPGLWLIFNNSYQNSFINWDNKRFFATPSSLCIEVPPDLQIETL